MSAQDDVVVVVQQFIAASIAADGKRIDDAIAGLEHTFFSLPQDDIGARAWVAPKAITLRAALRDLATQLKAARVPSFTLQSLLRAKDLLTESTK